MTSVAPGSRRKISTKSAAIKSITPWEIAQVSDSSSNAEESNMALKAEANSPASDETRVE